MGERRRRGRLAGVVAVLVAAGLATGSLTSAASAETDSQLKARQKAAQHDLAEAQEGLADTGQAAQAASTELAAVQAQAAQAQTALDAATATVRTAHDEDVALAGRLAAAQADEQLAAQALSAGQADIAGTSADLSRLVAAAYRGGGVDPGLAVALGAADPDDFTDRYVMVDAALRSRTASLSRLQEQRAEQAHRTERLEAVRAQVAVLRQQAADHLAATQKAEADAAAAKTQLDALAVQKASALATLQAQQAAYEQQVAAAQASSDDIAAQLRARAAARGASGSGGGSSGGAPAHTSGVLGAPLSKITVTSSFGWRIHPIYHTRRLHAGTDLRAACGTPVYAAADGEVVRAGPGTGYGNILVIDHGTVAGQPVATAYAHLSRFDVRVGQHVQRGQLVAHSGSTGVGTACHLHFEVRVAGTPVDATGWL